jgi:hypothetical protein
MEDKQLIEQSLQLIQKDLPIEGEFSLPYTLNDLEDYLTKEIKQMLDHDFNGLLNAFYRIDLNESQVNELLSTAEPFQLPRELARLVIERQMKKVITRQAFRS